MTVKRETVKIPSIEDNVFLDTWLFKPSGNRPFPLVIADHGYQGRELGTFGEKWASEVGLASLIFDYRFFGNSGEEPRNLVDLEKQIEDFRAVWKWARRQPKLFLNNRIVLMGSALSGLSVTRLALGDSSFAGVMAHSPAIDG
ncbi:hypothetical protein M422DRAFT_70436 [Sphaerobolus stellatus SS14]|uniref:Alpha/beta hydrolase n=1 Tax=Sphaerobolus stellatus (strain SS14) TaxID=990650 RepID=A0A0C9V6W3_SPHS4|nr:hypothetical protein M422DRAFT_70436 [Sphaerobolus stellatus SS14]